MIFILSLSSLSLYDFRKASGDRPSTNHSSILRAIKKELHDWTGYLPPINTSLEAAAEWRGCRVYLSNHIRPLIYDWRSTGIFMYILVRRLISRLWVVFYCRYFSVFYCNLIRRRWFTVENRTVLCWWVAVVVIDGSSPAVAVIIGGIFIISSFLHIYLWMFPLDYWFQTSLLMKCDFNESFCYCPQKWALGGIFWGGVDSYP